MLEVSRKHGMSVVRITAGDKLPRDARVCQASAGEWFPLIERPVDSSQCARYGIARIRASGSSEVRWYSGTGTPNLRALYVFAALENEKTSTWAAGKLPSL